MTKQFTPSSDERTPWFPGDVTPARRGVYLRVINFGTGAQERFSYWDGKQWGGYSTTAEAALESKDYRSGYQKVKWCGLARKP